MKSKTKPEFYILFHFGGKADAGCMPDKILFLNLIYKSHVLLSMTCISQETLALQQKGLERWGGEGWSPDSPDTQSRCMPLSTLIPLCLVQDLHTLMLCSNSQQVPSTLAHTVPSLWWQHVQLALWKISHQAILWICCGALTV